ncbi:MAG: hypothetical protein IIU35_01980, partial [Neisseriaceae bacterium]|nr:hypothetical protein [Neisseriaceae bacterium]
ELSINNCEKFKGFPEQIGNLHNLQILTVKFSPFQERQDFEIDTLFNHIGKLKNLIVLELVGIDSLRQLSDSIGNLHNLQYISFYHCRNLQKIPDSIFNLPKLKGLDLDKCTSLPSEQQNRSIILEDRIVEVENLIMERF